MSSTTKEKRIVEYIEMIYNGERVHQALGYQTPNEFEKKYFDEQFELTTMLKSVDHDVEVR